MSRTYLVMPGAAQQISSSLAAGNIIVNQDPASGVLLWQYNNVGPVNSYLLKPLETFIWPITGPLWAVVDTDVTSPVSITIGPQTSTPVKPVSTVISPPERGTGIPGAEQSDLIYSGTVDFIKNLDVHKYASLIIQPLPAAATGIPKFIGYFSWHSKKIATPSIYQRAIFCYYDTNNWPYLYQYVNRGDTLSFGKYYDTYTGSPSASRTNIFGSNQSLDKERIITPMGDQAVSLSWTGTPAAAGGVALTAPAALPQWTIFGGTVYGHLTIAATDAAPTGSLVANTVGLDNTAYPIYLINTNSINSKSGGTYWVDMLFKFVHPKQPVNYSFIIGEAHTAAVTINAWLTGA